MYLYIYLYTYVKNKLPWYPQQPQRVIFTNLSEACCEATAGFPWIKWPQILLNLTWHCTKPPRPSPERSPEPCWAWAWPGSAPKPPGTFSGTFSSPEPCPEPCWTWPGSAPKPPGTFFGALLNLSLPEPSAEAEPDLALHQSLPHLLRNLLGNPGSAPKPPRPSPELRNPVEGDPALHQSLPDLLWNLRNLLRNLVEPDPAPAPVHTGAILGWRPH